MQTVFSNAMVAHVWASQRQTHGRSNNGQFFFDGPTLYSYGRHYVAGFILPMPDGGQVFLVNGDSYSVTTSRHTSRALQATHGETYVVPGLTGWRDFLDAWNNPADRKEGLKHLRRTLKNAGNREPGQRFRDMQDWPGLAAAESMFRAMGDRNPERSAKAAAAAMMAAEAKRAARVEKAKRDAWAAEAKRLAARTGPEWKAAIREPLAKFGHRDHGIRDLKESRKRVHRAKSEAARRGWTRIVAELKAGHAAMSEAIRDADRRSAVAYRQRNRRHAIERFRETADRAATLESRLTAGIIPHATLGGPIGFARLYEETAAAAAGLSRHVPLSESTLARLAQIQAAARERAAHWQRIAQAERFAAEAEGRANWLSGRDSRRHARFSDDRGGALLRAVDVERDDSGAIVAGTLQTSHGAEVPLAHAIRAFRFLEHCRETGRSWRRNGSTVRVGHFQVDSVEPSGDFVAGCHRINWPEVERLAGLLGVAELAAADVTQARESV